jgi:hypothetical protein
VKRRFHQNSIFCEEATIWRIEMNAIYSKSNFAYIFIRHLIGVQGAG